MKFTKIKWDGEKVHLSWTEEALGGRTEHRHEFTSRDAPAARFLEALGALVPVVRSMLELPKTYETKLRVQSVSINYEEGDGRMGVVVTSLKELAAFNAPLVLNTPHVREPILDEEDGRPGFMESDLEDAIDELQQAAERYLQGDREQSDMFAGAAAGT